jgi:hypothetical protein
MDKACSKYTITEKTDDKGKKYYEIEIIGIKSVWRIPTRLFDSDIKSNDHYSVTYQGKELVSGNLEKVETFIKGMDAAVLIMEELDHQTDMKKSRAL